MLCERLEQRLVLAAGIAVADYQFTNHGLDGQTELFSRDIHPDSTASNISSPLPLGSTGNGEPPRGLALGGAFNETSEPTPATSSTDYFTFSITPAAGKPLSLADLSFAVRRNDPDSKNSFSIYYDEDPGSGGNNFSTRLFAGVVDSEDAFERFVIPLEGLSQFTELNQTLTFRYYAWGTAGVGTQRIDNVRVRAVANTVSSSAFAYYGDANRLIHPLDAQGNRIPDFSSAGYRNSAEPIPDVANEIDGARIVNVSPTGGDDMANIQAAIDEISALAPGANGFRGVIQLSAGEFQISDQLQILADGVVLRGVDDGIDASSNTILRATGTARRALIRVGAASGFASGTEGTRSVLDKLVPVGATSFHVESTDGWQVGDEIIVRRPSTAEWIASLGMDDIPARGDGGTVVQWQPGPQFDHSYERVISRIDGNKITINAPLLSALDQEYGGGLVFKYTFPRISEVGIENIRGVSDFASDTDEDHATSFIELQAVKDAWVTNVTGQHFVYATVHATSRALRVTVDDARSLAPKSIITGGRRYPFLIDGQFVLMRNLYSEEGRHDFVNNSAWRNRGPNVFLNGTAVDSHSSTGPHQRFSTGTLYDTITTDRETEARNRGNFGTGHGWAGANMVFWNNTSPRYLVQNPPTAQNWLIGSVGTIVNDTRFGQQPAATVDAHGTPIDFGNAENPTSSLFVAQRNRADGDAASVAVSREFVLGDFDLVEFDGSASQDNVYVDSQWQAQVSERAGILPTEDFDKSTDGQYVPFTFQVPIESGNRPLAAVLSLGLRGTGSDTRNDQLWIDSFSNARTFASLGLTDNLPVDSTTVTTIELIGDDLVLLDDGQLDLAIGQHTTVDWAHLSFLDGPAQTLALEIALASISENNGETTATVTRTNSTTSPLIVSLSSSDTGEAIVPTNITIPAGQTASPAFTIRAIDDGVRDRTQSVAITASASAYDSASSSLDVTDVLAHRTSELTIRVQDADGAPISDATLDIVMTEHAFRFGTQVRDRLFSISEQQFDALTPQQKRGLLSSSNTTFTPSWQDALNYRASVYENFNHVIPTNGLQWLTYENNGPSVPDDAIAQAMNSGLSVTGHAAVWGNDAWPTPNRFRPGATPNASEFHDELIAARLGPTSIMTRFSASGAGATILDWDVLNEPLNERYYASTFVAAGIYPSQNAAYTDFFVRANTQRPDAMLAINEYNILNSGGDANARNYRDLVNNLLAQGAPIDRIKIQAHIGRSGISKADITRRLDILAETGLLLQISEFDMRDDANQLTQAEQKRFFKDILEAMFEHEAVDGFSMWGFWDSAHWRGNGPLFDENWTVKDEASAWFDLVRGEWMPDFKSVNVDSSGMWNSDGNLFDGTYEITATSNGLSRTVSNYELTDDGELVVTLEQAELSVTIDSDSISENGGIAQVTISRSGDSSTALNVTLSSSDTSEATVPDFVTMLAGQQSVLFNVIGQDDRTLDGTQTVTLTASANNLVSGTATLEVIDDEIAELTLQVDTDSISENGGTANATVSRNSDTAEELIVNLMSSDTGEASVPTTVTFSAGQSSTTFAIGGIDDTIVDGDQAVTITATAVDHVAASRSINVADDETPELTLVIDPNSISENSGTAQATVTRNTDTERELMVTLTSSDPGEATMPETVIIAAGASSATFAVEAVDDENVDGPQAVNFTAAASNHASANSVLTVTDDDIAELALVIESDVISEAGGQSHVTVSRNAGGIRDLEILLTIQPAGRASIPQTVTVPAGASSTTFEILAIDDSLVLGDVEINITASATAFASSSDSLTIIEDDYWTWTNVVNPLDVNDDGFVSPIDALIVVNYLNGSPPAEFPALTQRPPHFLDVNNDGFASPIDALSVINALNREGEGEGESNIWGDGWPRLEDEMKRIRKLHAIDLFFASSSNDDNHHL